MKTFWVIGLGYPKHPSLLAPKVRTHAVNGKRKVEVRCLKKGKNSRPHKFEKS